MIRGYLRLSKDELDSHSPDTQRRQIREWATKNDHPEPVFYEDIGRSGYTEGDDEARPGFHQMLLDAEDGDVIVSVSTDRFARDSEVAERVAKKLAKRNVETVFLDFPVTRKTAGGKFSHRVKAAADELYRDVIQEKVLNAIPTVREKHIRWGRFPDLFEVVEEDGRRIVRPSARAVDLLARAKSVGPVRAAKDFGIVVKKVYRLRRSFAAWVATRPWYVAEKYDVRREESARKRRSGRAR